MAASWLEGRKVCRKIEKRPCLRNDPTDRPKSWLGDAYWPVVELSESFQGGPYGERGAQAYNGGLGQSLD